jgi:magnesium transporter
MEASGEEARNSFLKTSGLVGGEELRSMPLAQRAFRRLAWLGPNILLDIVAARVIALHQDTLQAALALGVLNGIVLGVFLGTAAALWKGNVYLVLVVGTALALNTLLSVILGGSIPILLRRFGVDPALASGPVLTTVTDMCGFFLVLSLARIALPLL